MLTKFLNLLFPSKCPICGSDSDNYNYNPLCTACWSRIEKYSNPKCDICGIPLTSYYSKICGECLKERPPFSKVIYYGIYKGKNIDKNDPLSVAIRFFKYKGIKRLSRPLSMLVSSLDIPKTNAIVPVPLHKKRLLSREFNQSALIAHHLSSILKTRLLLNNLFRVKNTLPQVLCKDKRERQFNVKGAFVAKDVKGLELLLIDDIVTEKSTITECSKTLLDAGAKNIYVVALAHSMPKE